MADAPISLEIGALGLITIAVADRSWRTAMHPPLRMKGPCAMQASPF